MKVRCISVAVNELHGKNWMPVDYSKGAMLQLDVVYTVYGVSLWKNSLNYLIVPQEATLPNWYPSELFVVTEELLHPETYFKYFGKDDVRGLQALWSYREMVTDFNHYVDLIERDAEAIKTFLKRKSETDDLQ
jgi:hypothetical protein